MFSFTCVQIDSLTSPSVRTLRLTLMSGIGLSSVVEREREKNRYLVQVTARNQENLDLEFQSSFSGKTSTALE